MTPQQYLERLGRRFDVPPGYGERFVPLVRRALDAGPQVRRRILQLVRASFAREAERCTRRREQRRRVPDWQLVETVARILHNWSPPAWAEKRQRDEGEPGPAGA
jgi:hypothetical protein